MMVKKRRAYQSLLVLYYSMVASLLVLSAVMYYAASQSQPVFDAGSHRHMLIIVLFVATVCFVMMGFLWKKDLGRVQAQPDLRTRARLYHSAAVKSYALHHAPGLLSLVCYFLTHNIRFLIVVAIIIIGLILIYPVKRKVALHIGVSEEELERLEA